MGGAEIKKNVSLPFALGSTRAECLNAQWFRRSSRPESSSIRGVVRKTGPDSFLARPPNPRRVYPGARTRTSTFNQPTYSLTDSALGQTSGLLTHCPTWAASRELM